MFTFDKSDKEGLLGNLSVGDSFKTDFEYSLEDGTKCNTFRISKIRRTNVRCEPLNSSSTKMFYFPFHKKIKKL